VVQLGLRANWQQFTLLVIVNAFVGTMVGLERSIVPLLGHQDPLASDTVAEAAREEIRQRFDHTEAHDEGEHRCRRSQAEDTLPEQRHDAAFESYHPADEGVDDHQQRELLPIGA